MAHRTTKTTMGTTFATVTTRFTTTAPVTPRRTSANTAHRPTLASATASTESPCPSAGKVAPSVDITST
ncbi:hypothetical protein KDY119_01351 [Luteimicrobium xylanilyticum]|uniref:Uncharacterized protein n=1 Tax=Luteimicrobium xylanilyticum TaxID=1133546 RepID=A0A5P9QBL9_9MICO|nr:hypothetical protein [Luteimicrobium xylanilyticum]QFU97845.1 hypothetical protein KDY119_01351 [Luteimicrobium xylanilyticum]